MAKVKYGLIGFGGIAENRVAKEGYACDKNRFAPLQFAELVAATDINQGRKEAAEALGLKWFASADEMLADPEIQAVYIATNNTTHVPLAMKALNAGKHVISEKPMATNSADAKALVALAKEKGLSLGVDHMMVYNAWNVKAESMIKAGELGNINDSCFHMEFAYGYDPAEAATWRCSKIEEMGGPIGDVASHCFYLSEYILGKKITKLAAVYLPKIMNTVAEDGAYIKFFFEDGMQSSAKVAFSELRGGLGGTLSNLGYEIYGDKAALRGYGTMFQLSGHADEPVKVRLELDKFDGKAESVAPCEIKNMYQCLIEHHAQSVLNGTPLTAEDALHNIELCEAAHESAQNGGKVIELN
ncbi:MAG: Gfo/Idh/MocA family oxidoreductase [Lentisphaeria bacterium]|nr:Gfo/Idh/MocA family oxidoreductase [Lentisphaeria bacterium]